MSSTVVIVGGGPAGLSCAIHLARTGVTVTVVANGKSSAPPIQTVPPVVRHDVLALSVPEACWAESSFPCYGIEACWGASAAHVHSVIQDPYGPWWHIRTHRLQKSLRLAAASCGVVLLDGEVVGVRRGGSWRVDVVSPDQQQLTCEFLIDATGRRAAIGRMLGARVHQLDSLVAAFAILDSASLAMTLSVEAVAGGWWYTCPATDGRAMACFVTDGDIARTLGVADRDAWLTLLEQTRLIRSRVRYSLKLPADVMIRSCASTWIDRAAGHAWLAIGDSLSATDPLASRGIFKALASGKQAAQIATRWLIGDRHAIFQFECEATQEQMAYASARLAHYDLERRWPAGTFWRRRSSNRAA